ncbi:MAG: TVP38/TMEM64 family protein [Eubacteriales bacterium]|nr:TVP38/TMEM64 family protein [Eubacteriales bacterium]
MKITKKQIVWSGIFLLIIAAAVILYFVGKSRGWFAPFESKENVQEYVRSFGAWAPLAFFFLQFIQVILSPIPGSITTVAGGVLFGFFYAFLISTAAIFLGSICAFLLGKLFGRPLVEKIAGKEVVEKYMQSVSSRQKIVLIMMFLLPFFPDDLLCLIAGLSAMRLPYFSFLVIITRPWGLLFSALLGSGMISMPGWGWIALAAFVIIVFIASLKYAPLIEERTKRWLENKFHKKTS